jgi:ABC-type sugar transport system substrate-binding protein
LPEFGRQRHVSLPDGAAETAMDTVSPFPRAIGRYVLYDELGSGGMAAVHFGRLLGPAGFARPVAIKRLHAQYARDPEFVRMFLDEARLAARIQHPNVVPMLDALRVKGEVFLVMDYVAGASLSHLNRLMRRRSEQIPPLVAVAIVAGMLHGLHAAHEAKDEQGAHLEIVHRDVSPQNALVGTDGVARLIDFGIAKATGRLQSTRSGQLKGKLAYMAPEQVRGEPVTRRADVYSASVILWETLTSKRLFEADNEANLLSQMLTAEVALPSSVVAALPRSLDRAVMRGLQRDPAKRYESAREMAAHIEACIGVASPSEVSDWLERTVGDELRERAARIESLERSGGEIVSVAGAGESANVAAADSLTVGGKRMAKASETPVRIGLFLRALDNEYQHLQREECLHVARRYGFVVAEASGQNDADIQRRQIEECLKQPDAVRPTVLLVHPVDEVSLRDTAMMAARAGVNWVSLNRDVDYLDDLRLDFPDLLVCSVSPDQRQVGRIHGRQLQILLPDGGDVFYVQGPPGTSTGRLRLEATQAELAHTAVRLIVESADWTIEGAAELAARRLGGGGGRSVGSVSVVCAQNDGMAIGARSVLLDSKNARGADMPRTVRAIGCDGSPSYGRRLVDEKSLIATVVIPPTTGRAIEEIALWFERGGAAPTAITMAVRSFPSLLALRDRDVQTSVDLGG